MIKNKFKDKVIWISGAAQGIGQGIAEYFASEGAQVALIDIKKEKGELLEATINSAAGVSKFFLCDVSDETSIKDSISRTVSHFGDLHILVNNAAVNIIKPLHECTSEECYRSNTGQRAVFLSPYPHSRLYTKLWIPQNVDAIAGTILRRNF
jgi:NAD(P)-dependent dehydrogenase (short-subunit alcohol dehydrogenase family)